MIAVDWSGNVKRAEESIWLAEVRDGELTALENGRDRGSEDAFDATVSALVMSIHEDALVALAASTDPTLAVEGKIWCPD